MGLFGFSSVKDMFDGGGRGGSGSEYSTQKYEDYKNSYRERYGNDDPNASRHVLPVETVGASTERGYDSLRDMFDGGGKGGSGKFFSNLSHSAYLEKIGSNNAFDGHRNINETNGFFRLQEKQQDMILLQFLFWHILLHFHILTLAGLMMVGKIFLVA